MSTTTLTRTAGASGNALAPQALANSASVSFNVNLSGDYGGDLCVQFTTASAAQSAGGIQIDVRRQYGSAPITATVKRPSMQVLTAGVVSTTFADGLTLSPGVYQITLTNLDTANGLTAVSATLDTYTNQTTV
ncbi:hypothetical protein CCAX7_54430 [Capsulimonas corticalis]|uniref:Uncharacterized protein n=1 Tax=Capsulimonas corticalis TaxID=2219043 RepID=A0A402D622_9BACT|nr:hypothetical protein [Capsulimonas corticalis]BDI33392.1 hypothetical protein CCAX7_54430 [Capsulimonas corticalis]